MNIDIFTDVQSSISCYTYIEACQIAHFSTNITVNCTFSSSSVSSFQVIAQLTEGDAVYRLTISQNVDFDLAATIQVDSDGVYRITVLPIRSGIGIMLDSCQYAIFSQGMSVNVHMVMHVDLQAL